MKKLFVKSALLATMALCSSKSMAANAEFYCNRDSSTTCYVTVFYRATSSFSNFTIRGGETARLHVRDGDTYCWTTNGPVRGGWCAKQRVKVGQRNRLGN